MLIQPSLVTVNSDFARLSSPVNFFQPVRSLPLKSGLVFIGRNLMLRMTTPLPDRARWKAGIGDGSSTAPGELFFDPPPARFPIWKLSTSIDETLILALN